MVPLRFISSVSTQSFVAWPSSLDFHRTYFIARIRITKCAKFEPMLVYFEKFDIDKLVRGSDSMRIIKLKFRML
jgi:hypothetical protein